MDEIKGFSGLCLENELTVISENNKIEFEAFIAIIDEIVDITVSSVKDYADAHNGQIPTPFKKVDDEEFIKKFNECKNAGKSQYYKELLDKHYESIKGYMFNLDKITDKTYEEMEPDARYCLTVFLFYLYVYIKLPKVKDVKIFRI